MLLDLEGGGAVIFLIVWLIALAEAITADEALVRNLPKMVWILLILITLDVGAILWFLLGRPRRARRDLPYKGNTARTSPAAGGRRGPVAPDDDPAFLDSLRSDKLRSWEDDLLRRERELRQKKDDEES